MFLKLQILQVKDILVIMPKSDINIEKANEILAELISLEKISGEHVILFETRETHMENAETEMGPK